MICKSIICASSLAVLASLVSCSSRQGWSIEGKITGAKGQRIALQAFNNNNWYTIDSLTVDADGDFKYQSATAAAFPDVYRISIDDKDIYFPVDSTYAIKLMADATDLTAYKLDGMPSAKSFVAADSLIRSTIAVKGEAAALNDSLLKRNLSEIVLGDDGLMAAYYIINKRVGGKSLFDPANGRDRALIGAVAQRFINELPDDPRTQSLKAIYLSAKAAANPELVSATNVEVPESSLPADIQLYDNRGVLHSLYEIVGKGKPVLLSFTSYDMESSPAYNVILADIYKQYGDRGLEIYQVGFDSDEVGWKQSAVNLPWVTVWNSPSDGNSTILNYNVNRIPLTYIINADGELTKRVEDPTTLAAEVAKVVR